MSRGLLLSSDPGPQAPAEGREGRPDAESEERNDVASGVEQRFEAAEHDQNAPKKSEPAHTNASTLEISTPDNIAKSSVGADGRASSAFARLTPLRQLLEGVRRAMKYVPESDEIWHSLREELRVLLMDRVDDDVQGFPVHDQRQPELPWEK